MARAKRIDSILEGRIREVYRQQEAAGRKVTAATVQRMIVTELAGGRPIADFSKAWPGESAVYKIIKKYKDPRNRANTLDDRPWSVMAMAFSTIPAESLAAITLAWAKSLDLDHPLTIRDAKWIARIGPMLDYDMNTLLGFAKLFSLYEKLTRVCEDYPTNSKDAGAYWMIDLQALIALRCDRDLFFRVFDRVFAEAPAALRDEQRRMYSNMFDAVEEDLDEGKHLAKEEG